MTRNPYLRFRSKELTLNDYLAIDRTILANERTLLSYARSALTLLVIGGSCIKFFDALWIQVVGVAFLALAVFVMARGWQRYRRTSRFLAAALEQRTGMPDHPLKGVVAAAEAESAAKPPPLEAAHKEADASGSVAVDEPRKPAD